MSGHLTLDGAVGFHVVKRRKDGALCCLAPGNLYILLCGHPFFVAGNYSIDSVIV